MMDEKRLEQEYRRLKRQQAPDLWNRIERSLSEHPEREFKAEENSDKILQREPDQKESISRDKKRISLSRHGIYGMATAAAAMLVLLAAPRLMEERLERAGNSMMAPAMAEETAEPMFMEEIVKMDAPETEGDRALPQAAPEEAAEEEAAEVAGGSAGEDSGEAEAGLGAANGSSGIDAGGTSPTTMARAGVSASSQESPAKSRATRKLPEGVLSYDQLQLAAYQPVALPETAVTVREDSQYFSEDILKDTQLLCGGTVTGVSLEEDESGRAVKVVYEIQLERVYFAEDYTTGMTTITVKSPIVRTDGDEVYILYQLQPGGTYLLPLHKPEKDWELLYPFAPQIQVTGEGAYLFHSGYVSLVNEDTSVVLGSPEGSNDYFYDRMVLRKDDEFLSELLALVEH